MAARSIRTPKGKHITPKQYVVLHMAAFERNGDTPPCVNGHYGCAVWEDGPCSAELAADMDMAESR